MKYTLTSPPTPLLNKERGDKAQLYRGEVFLLIEVADSSLKYDREVKALAYAKSGIGDYWILDVNQRKLHVYRLPSPDGYQSETILSFICDDFTAGIC